MLKKLIALLLCLTVLFAAAACSSESSTSGDAASSEPEGSEESISADEPVEPEAPESRVLMGEGTAGTGERTIAVFSELYDLDSREFTLTMKIVEAPDMTVAGTATTLAVRGNQLFFRIFGDTMNASALYDGNKSYSLMPSIQKYMVGDLEDGAENGATFDEMIDELFGDMHADRLKDLPFTVGTATIDGVEYDYESLTDEDGVPSVLFFDRETGAMRYQSNAIGSLIEITEYSKTADASLFEIPQDYTELTQEELEQMTYEELVHALGMGGIL